MPGNTPVPAGVNYLIVTGERRYWAHVLLAVAERKIQEGLETRNPDTIKATIEMCIRDRPVVTPTYQRNVRARSLCRWR